MKATAQKTPSFIESMKALPVEELPEGDRVYEIKHDGYRALAFKDGKEERLIARNKKVFDYPQLLDSLKKLPAGRVILDGEIAALDEKGRSSFQLLQLFKKSGGIPLVYYVFDVLFLEGKDLRGQSLSVRPTSSLRCSTRPLKISGSLVSSAAPRRSCSGSRNSLASKAWSPKKKIQSTKAAGAAAPRSNSRSPSLRSS